MKKKSRIGKIAMLSSLVGAAVAVTFWITSYLTKGAMVLGGGGPTPIVVRSVQGDLVMARFEGRPGKKIDDARAALEQALVLHRVSGEIGSFLGFALFDQVLAPKVTMPVYKATDGGVPDSLPPGERRREEGDALRSAAWFGFMVIPWWFFVVALAAWPMGSWVARQLKEDKGPRRKRWLRNQAWDQMPRA